MVQTDNQKQTFEHKHHELGYIKHQVNIFSHGYY